MGRFRYILIVVLFFSCQKAPTVATFAAVKEGRNLHNIKEVSVDYFFNMWVHNKISKIESNLEELYQNSTYVYLGKKKAGLVDSKILLYKVNADSLTNKLPNYTELNGYRLMLYLWDELVPKEDKELWKNSKCASGRKRPVNKYTLVDKKVVLTMSWQIKNCEELYELKDKQYAITYNLITKQIEE